MEYMNRAPARRRNEAAILEHLRGLGVKKRSFEVRDDGTRRCFRYQVIRKNAIAEMNRAAEQEDSDIQMSTVNEEMAPLQ